MRAKKRDIPFKNYIYLSVIFIITILLTFYVNAWVKAYNTNKLSVSPLVEKVSEVNINELELTLSERNKSILYIGYVNDAEINSMENKMLRIINKNELNDMVLYLNITDDLKNNKYIEELGKIFPNYKNKLKSAPILIYIEKGVVIKIINNADEVGLNDLIKTFNINE